MTCSEFRKQMKKAAALVATWPAWKRNILEESGQPMVKVPRKPVDNRRS